MLQYNRVHADSQPTIFSIGMVKSASSIFRRPSARRKQNAFRNFQRDLLRVSEYFNAMGVKVDSEKLSRQYGSKEEEE
jgi:hypothetical protein